ncbi:MAG: GNAT family N-acetyltransferase [Flavipsychrobacter sp.]
MSVVIRKADKDDVALLCRMGAEIFQDTYAVHNTAENMQQYIAATYSEQAILHELNNKQVEVFIAEYDREAAGYVKISTTNECRELAGRKYFEIERLYVYSKYQGLKIGYALVNACITHGRQNAFNTIWLGVWERNVKAIGFYQKLGFVTFSEHIFKLGDDLQNDYLMKLDI